LPPTYVFADIRSIVLLKTWDQHFVLTATALNIAYLMATSLFFHAMWKSVKKRGLLTKFEVY
jgi:hypothetical protein